MPAHTGLPFGEADEYVTDTWWNLWLQTLGYEVNEYTAPILRAIDKDKPRFICIYGGERSGKSFNTVALAGMRLPPEAYPKQRLYWIIGPDFNQCRREFQYLYETYDKLGLVTRCSMPEATTVRWFMELSTNERWETKSSADIAKLATFSIHGAMIVEANQHPGTVWLKLRGRLAENRGWCIMSGTYEDCSEWFVDIFEKWSAPNQDGGISFSLPTWANAKAFPGGYDDPEIQSLKASIPESWFNERYAGIPTKPSNVVIPEFDYLKHVGTYVVDEDEHVELAVDPGKKCYCVAFVQKRGDTCVVLDCMYFRGQIAQTVIPLVMKHPLWKFLPPTGLVGAIDIAAIGEPATISQQELWQAIAGVSFWYKKHPEHETINLVRNMLGENRLFFNNLGNESAGGESVQPLAEFRMWKYPDEIAAITESAKPIDRNNHFIKAIAYYLAYRFPVYSKNPKPVSRPGAVWRPNGNRGNQALDRRLREGANPIQRSRQAMGRRLETPVLVRERVGRSRKAP